MDPPCDGFDAVVVLRFDGVGDGLGPREHDHSSDEY